MSISIQTPIKKAYEPLSPIQSSESSFGSLASYVIYLEKQTDIRDSAIKTAQDLIKMYQGQNECLKEENNQLRLLLSQKNQSTGRDQHKFCQINLLRYSQRIRDLLQNRSLCEERINLLQRQLNLALKWIEKNHGKMIEKDIKKRKYYKIQESEEDPEVSFFEEEKKTSRKKQIFEQANKHKIQKMLQLQLKNKDQEVIQLLKRLHNVQDRVVTLTDKTPQSKKNKDFHQTAPTLRQQTVKKNNSSFDSFKF